VHEVDHRVGRVELGQRGVGPDGDPGQQLLDDLAR